MKSITIRASALDAFALCPRRFYYNTFTSISQMGSHAMALGTAVHQGIASFWEAKKGGLKKEFFDHTLAAQEALEKEVQTRLYDGLNFQKASSTAQFLTSWYVIQHEHSADEPMAVEVALQDEIIPGVTVTGHPDLIIKDKSHPGQNRLMVIDHKVKKVAYSPREVDRLFQLTAYSFFVGLGWFKAPGRGLVDEVNCRVDNLVHGPMEQVFRVKPAPDLPEELRTGQPKMVEIKSKRTLRDLETLKAFLRDVQQRGPVQDHYPVKQTPMCQTCSYRLHCQGGRAFLQHRNIPLLADLEKLPVAA